MLRTAMMMFALAVSSMSVGCVDDDGPVEDGPKVSGEDDPDFQTPGDSDEDQTINCHQLQDGKDDQPACTPK